MSTLGRLVNVINGSDTSEDSFQSESEAYREEQQKALYAEDIETRRNFNDMLKTNNIERVKYARHLFWLTASWCFLIFVILGLVGFERIPFHLENDVLITLINLFDFFISSIY